MYVIGRDGHPQHWKVQLARECEGRFGKQLLPWKIHTLHYLFVVTTHSSGAKSREMTEFTRVLFPVHCTFPVLWPEHTCLVVIQISDSCYGRRAFLCPFGVCDSAGGTLLSRGFPLGGDFGRRDDGVVTCSAFISATKPGS